MILLELRKFHKKDFNQISNIFKIISNDSSAESFHPHQFNDEQAMKLANYQGQDLYFGVYDRNNIVGYGLLRGWDENFEIPSLGIYLIPSYRGKGLASTIMSKLHDQAKLKNAKKIRLKVYPHNQTAVNLYTRIGYIFKKQEDNQLVGILDLNNN